MRIAIDARAYFQRTGIARYTRELVHAVLAADRRNEFLWLISDRHTPEEIRVQNERVEVRVSRAGWLDGRAEHAEIEREVRGWHADVFHSIFPPLAVNAAPSLVTVFDLTPLSHSQFHRATVVKAFRAAIRPAMAAAARVIAISRATAAEACRRFPEAAPRTRVAGLGLPKPFLDAPLSGGARAGVLFVGTIEPRKNVPLVVEAARQLRARGCGAQVTIVGKRGWGGYDVAAATAGLSGVRYLGFVDDAELRALYRGAAIFLYPSSVEGFGLPVLEAMSQGALPLISPDPALKEVVGDPELVVDVGDPGAVADAIVRWSMDAPGRTDKTERLTQRARRHTWRRAARRIAHLYREVA